MTEYEIKTRLLRKGFTEDEIGEVLERLREWNYVNDYNYAVSYCQSRGERHPRRRIREELRQKGIAGETLAKVMTAYYPEEQEAAQCIKLAKILWDQEQSKQLRKAAREDHEEDGTKAGEQNVYALKQRIGQKLAARGYTGDSICYALERLATPDLLD